MFFSPSKIQGARQRQSEKEREKDLAQAQKVVEKLRKFSGTVHVTGNTLSPTQSLQQARVPHCPLILLFLTSFQRTPKSSDLSQRMV